MSAVNKAALPNDVICEEKIDILVVTVTWIPSDAQRVVLKNLAPLANRSYFNKLSSLAIIYRLSSVATSTYQHLSDHNIKCFNSTLFKLSSTIIHNCRRSFRRLNYTSFENDLYRTFEDLLTQDKFASALNTTLNDIVN
ncbi:hypothetical protein HELRODRAFT_165011 [Helobdella robusta]|uniref:Uncharacterized protein n=1 Tax=Helobdella robusta TaxID=6412 RepID=T1EW46_HELRO|nr:hypothetical protein HELRODRAFT_165011 [Helobdella robusta]ESN92880.1 hypothetical protein HELRODRAFT_165011 [Helobdella robusta]